ncbi:MAG: heat-shock protein [Mariprofundaceae bacterium]
MTNVTLFVLTLASWLLLGWLWWDRRQAGDSGASEREEDKRITPLLRGVNYLLSDKPDHALRELVEVAKLHTDTAEVYLALGGMFRSKGEIGRAVRIHQNILARPGLSHDMHIQACMALGKDYQAGGFRARALQQYARVLEMQSGHVPALEACLRMREQAHEWPEAEDILSRLDRIQGAKSALHRAYLVAEMARESLQQGEAKQAVSLAEKAISLDETCASAHVLLTDIHLRQENHDKTVKCLERLAAISPEHLPLLAAKLVGADEFYRQYGWNFLYARWQEHHDEALALAWLEAVKDKHGAEAVDALLPEVDLQASTLRVGLRVLALKQGSTLPGVYEQASQWRRKARNFACRECGVEVVEMRWQCPQCHHWGSMHPIEGDPFDA